MLEFLYFYLLPEEHNEEWHSGRSTDTMRKIRGDSGRSGKSSEGKSSSWGDMTGGELDERNSLRTVREKQKMLGKYLSNAGGLAQEFKIVGVFETAVG